MHNRHTHNYTQSHAQAHMHAHSQLHTLMHRHAQLHTQSWSGTQAYTFTVTHTNGTHTQSYKPCVQIYTLTQSCIRISLCIQMAPRKLMHTHKHTHWYTQRNKAAWDLPVSCFFYAFIICILLHKIRIMPSFICFFTHPFTLSMSN